MAPAIIKPSIYRGRFAPSPSGLLHFGSLVTALASFLDAKAHQGVWLLRMEDLDPPREQAGAAEGILKSLETHHLLWDGSVMFQSSRLEAYEQALSQLSNSLYPCQCSRQQIRAQGRHFDSQCREAHNDLSQPLAQRLRVDGATDGQMQSVNQFDDVFMGKQTLNLIEDGDFILKRKDGLFAYQLAVVVDDIAQGITHVIRGADLLESTARQRYITHLLGGQPPIYGHTPVVMGENGFKLSKQYGAEPIDDHKAFDNLVRAFRFLDCPPEQVVIDERNIDALLRWGVGNWQRERLRHPC